MPDNNNPKAPDYKVLWDYFRFFLNYYNSII